MSVPAGLREEGKLKVLTVANDLLHYTKQICNNEKYFPKRIRWISTIDIVKYTYKLVDSIVFANAIKVENEEDFKRRYNFQKTAYELTFVLVNRINLAYMEQNIDGHKMEVWSEKIYAVQYLLRNWISKDKERFNKK